MEAHSLQAHELHRKFEDLNEEISTALQRQQDALSANASSGSVAATAFTKKDMLRLAKRAIDWREDVTQLAKHIDLQFQNSRALRSQEAHGLLSTSAASQKQQEDYESAKLRCLRSDLRLLLDFRVGFHQLKSDKEPANALALLSDVEAEAKQLKGFIERSVKKEKTGSKDALIVELFEMRREFMSKISEDILKEKQQLDLEVGALESLTTVAHGMGDTERDNLDVCVYDACHVFLNCMDAYIKMAQALLDLQKEMRDRFAIKTRSSNLTERDNVAPLLSVKAPSLANNSKGGGDGLSLGARAFSTDDTQLGDVRFAGSSNVTPTTSLQGNKNSVVLDDVQFLVQKLKRELADLKAANAKLVLTNSQMEDDLVHLQHRFDEEKRAHLNGKRLHIPKVQKLEEVVQTTAKAFDELKLSVDLIINMYKSLVQTLATRQEEEDDVKKERDRITLLLSSEIKKIAVLTKENERKDKLVTLAMAARYEMIQHANRNESLANERKSENTALTARVKSAEDEVSVLKVQLDGVYARLETAEDIQMRFSETITQLHNEMRVTLEAARTQEQEMRVKYEREAMVLQAKFDKTKRELLDAMSQNLNLDGRLRKAHEKITRMANIAGNVAGATPGGHNG
uniref:Uncharacterized protein n=1 Tax=Globisporangium ultimum (strain ATCC 200006 / CBS 805.95 / DAOM BR144) TaxID=431595 RepID=K3WIE4_GLOUD